MQLCGRGAASFGGAESAGYQLVPLCKRKLPTSSLGRSDVRCISNSRYVQQGPPPGSEAERILQAIPQGPGAIKAAAAPENAFRSSPYVTKVEYPDRYVTSETNPAAHTFAHIGRYYTLGDDDAMKGLAPSGFPGGMNDEFDTTYVNALQVKPAGVWLVAHLEHWRQTRGRKLVSEGKSVLDVDPASPYSPPDLRLPAQLSGLVQGEEVPAYSNPLEEKFHPARVVVGPPGVGKSGVLSYALHYARTNGWLAINVPDCYHIMHLGKVLVKSKRRPEMIDQHDMALNILRDLLGSQESVLSRVPQRGQYAKFRYLPSALDVKVTAEREKLRLEEEAQMAKLKAKADAEGRAWDPSSFQSKYEDETDKAIDRSTFTLADMVQWGIRHPSQATDCFLDLLAEVRQVTEVPVMVVVDGANHLYAPSAYAMDGVDVPARELSIPAAIMPFNESGFDARAFGMKRGLWLMAVSFRHHQNMNETMFGHARVVSSVRLPVKPMTRMETYCMLRHYKAAGTMSGELPDGEISTSNRFLMLIDEGTLRRSHSSTVRALPLCTCCYNHAPSSCALSLQRCPLWMVLLSSSTA